MIHATHFRAGLSFESYSRDGTILLAFAVNPPVIQSFAEFAIQFRRP